jgi:hypothetical protein
MQRGGLGGGRLSVDRRAAMGSQAARYWIVGAAAAVFGFAAIANAWATRGRFFGWAVLTAVVALALAGL